MMQRLFLEFVTCFAVAIAVCVANARVVIGENILVNGALEADQVDFPQGWTFFPTRMVRPEWHPTGGPGGIPCVTFANEAGSASGSRQMRQLGIRLSHDGRYRISAWVRPRIGFSSEKFWVLAVNDGWHASRGVRELPPVGRWTRVSKDFRGFKSKGDYYCTVGLNGFYGSIDVADLRLEALDETAAAGAEYAVLSEYQSAPRIVPWGPLLGEIPNTTREVSFRFLGKLPDGVSPNDCDMVMDDSSQALRVVSGGSEANKFRIPDGTDKGTLSVRVVHRESGSNFVARTFRYKTVNVPSAENLAKHRRLNNYVTEVLHRRFQNSRETLYFGVAGRRWIHVAVRSDGAFSVALDGVKVLVPDSADCREAFREIAPGDHVVAVEGVTDGDEISVRTIPEILNYAPVSSRIKEIPPFDWGFQKSHALPAVTTMNGGVPPSGLGEMAAYRASGRKWLANFHPDKSTSPEDLAARLLSAKGMTDPQYDGITCDELFCGRDAANSTYIQGLRKYDLEAKPTRSIYTWLVGKPMSGIFDAEFLAECANVSLGRGMVMTETYCRSRATEEEARTYIESYICEKMRRFMSAWPPARHSVGMVLGNFAQPPLLSLHHHCGVDYRYYLDMQFNALANNPAFDGIRLAGFWGSYYNDEDALRWCFMLLRHYCIAGRTEMLSERYGLAYNLGFVKNPDFRQGLDGWMADGSVTCDSVKDFGERSLGLYGGAGGCGDDFAVFERGDSPNRLSQKICGLVPGETYALQFVTFDADDAREHRFAPRRFGIAVDLGNGAMAVPGRSWVHIDRRKKTKHGEKNDASISTGLNLWRNPRSLCFPSRTTQRNSANTSASTGYIL